MPANMNTLDMKRGQAGGMPTAEEWSASLPYCFVWMDYISVPQPSVEEEQPSGTTDHTKSKSTVAMQLQQAVDSIPGSRVESTYL